MSLEQSHFQIQEILFTDDYYDDIPFDIGPSVIELNIYEDIEKTYLTGTMLQVDNVGFKSTVGITGSERIEITLKAATGTLVTKKFIISAVQKEVSSNERTDVRLLSLIEEHAFLSNIIKVSKAYRGEPATIISNILSGYLDKKLTYNIDGVREPNIKVIIPNLNPLDAVDWIRDKMATSIGAPFFLYASLQNPNITIAQLETLITADAWNKENPYTYGQTSHNQTLDSNTEVRKLFNVEHFAAAKIESTLQLAKMGAISAEYNTVDVTSGEMYKYLASSDVTVGRLLDRVGQKLSPQEQNGLNFNSTMNIGTSNRGVRRITGYASRIFTNIAADTYHDVNSYNYEKEDQYRLALKMKAAQLRTVMTNNVYTITVPGVPYLINPNAGVGSNIQVNFAKNTVDPNQVTDIDSERSGKFLVYRARHQFIKPSRYAVHMNIVKLTRTAEQ
jgi:hypothetical protein